ncbi:retention module-containing protein [Aquitalea sp. LB_tupeE]|uniref:retention module-containing protein n=1 Tax=Aquitalea sp. LB_tupeE TaxID=2748078 RepID=UPI0015BD273A|nr:retention module-containing protein [Aquitalea sp. LB_tupeE]NWK78019.1 retention module-containing protein [Aquitalea sp. LB_tupeE]
MSTTAVQGQVVAVNGVAKAIDAQGHERILKAGDIIQPGERVVLLDGATLSVARADGELLNVDGPREMALTPETMQPQTTDKTEAAVAKLAPEAQQVLAALENGQDPLAQLDSAAAGLNGAGGADEGSHGFVRLMRVSESLGGALGEGAGAAAFNLQSVQADTTSNTPAPVSVSIDNISATNDATPTIHGTGIPGLTVIVTNTSGTVIGSAVVGSDGNWTITPTSPLPDGTDTLIATSTNTAGVTATATGTAIIDTTPPATPTVTITEHNDPNGVISTPDLVNGKVEATVKLDAADLAKNGSATIVVNDGGHTATLVVHADGSVTGTDSTVAASYKNGTVTLSMTTPADGESVRISATQTDAVGNKSGQGSDSGTLHTEGPAAPSVTIQSDSNNDGILNVAETKGHTTVDAVVQLSDMVIQAGGSATVTIVDNGVTSTLTSTLTVDKNGVVSSSNPDIGGEYVNGTLQLYGVPLPGDGNSISISAVQADQYGNTSASASDSAVERLGVPAASITVDPVTADNVLNIKEVSDSTVTITGTVGGDVQLHDKVTLTVNGNPTTGEVIDLGGGKLGFSIAVSSADLKADSHILASVTTSNDAGNSTTATADHAYGLDLNAPTIAIATTLAGDDVINAAEQKQDLTISGSTTGVENGQTVDVVLNGTHYQAIVNGNSWSVSVPQADVAKLADGKSYTITADVSDKAGNPAQEASHHLSVDTSATITITNDGSGGDHIFNQNEAGKVNVSGTTTGVEPGQPVYVTFTDGAHSVTSIVYVQQDGSWNTADLTLNLNALKQGQTSVTASVTDLAGNSASDSLSKETLDTKASITIVNDGSGKDGVFNKSEAAAAAVSGTTSDVEEGRTVTVTFTDSQNHTVSVDTTVGKDGSWSVPAQSLSTLVDGAVTVKAQVSDLAGNVATDSHSDSLDTTASIKITNDGSGSDSVFNKSEAAAAAVSGTTSGVEAGRTVTVTFTDSQNHTVSVDTKVGANGGWSVPAQSLSTLVDGAVTVKAQVSDAAGNTATDSHKDGLDTKATITITNDGSGGDHIFNQSEAGKVNVSGTTTGVEPDQPVYVTFTDGAHSVTSIVYVQQDGSWNTADLTLNLNALKQGQISVTASVTDLAGNSASDSLSKETLDTVPPTLAISTLAGDDIINAKEHTQPLTISGTTSAEDGQKVDVVLNGIHYSATVSGGNWSTVVSAGDVAKLADGKSYTVTADVRDAAGNAAPEASHAIAVDVTAPDAPKVSFVSSGTYSYSNYFGIDDAHISTPASGQNALTTVLGDLVNLNPTATFIAQSINFGTSTGAWQDSSLAVNSNLGTSGALQDFITNSNGSTGTNLQLAGNYGTTSRAIVETGGVFTAATGNYTIAVRADDGYMLMIDGKVVAQEVNNQSPATAWYTVHLDATANNQHTIQMVYWDQGGLATLQVSLEQNGNNIVNLLQPGSTVTAQVTLNANDQAVLVNGGSVHLTGSGNTDLTLHLENGKLVDSSHNSYSYQNGVISLSMAAPAAGASISLAATVANKDGNVSPSTSASYSQPGIPTGHLQHDAANDTGSNTADSITADKTPVITGTADANSQITVSLNGHNYTTTADGSGHWSVSVTDSLGDGVYIPLVKAVDSNGATATGFGTAFAVDTTATISISSDGSGSGGVFNKSEAASAAVSGTTSGVEAGQTVTLTFTDSAHHVLTTTTQVGSDGSWSVPAQSLSTLVDGAVTVKAQVSDLAGNVATDSHSDSLDTKASITIVNDGSGKDGVFNKSEAAAAAVSGTTSGVEAGRTVTVTFTDSQNHTVSVDTKVGANGGWSVPAQSLSTLVDGAVTVKAQVSDAAGNTATDSHKDGLDTKATITITNDGSGGDHIFNQSEAGKVNVSGTTTGVEPDQPVYVTFTDGAHSVTSIVYVQQDGSWNTADLTLNLNALKQGQISVTASVTDLAGNSASDSLSKETLDTQAPLAAQLSSSTSTAAITGLFNTGLDASGNAQTTGVADAHYTLVVKPAGAHLNGTTVVSQTDAQSKSWVTNDYTKSQWIGDMSDNYGRYTYQTTFKIASAADVATVLISFDLSADDNVHILVNGKDTGLSYNTLWTQIQHVDLSNDSGAGKLFVVGDNTLTFEVDNSGGGATGLKVDNMVATAQSEALELNVSLAGTGAVANDTLTITAVENGVTTNTTHVLTSSDISHGIVSQSQYQPEAHTVSTYTATLTDKAGNVSTVATETVFGSGDHAVSDGVGVDTFKWTLASNGNSSAPATTTISNFDLADHANGGSALDLKDLLQGENHASGIGNLTSYLHFTQSGSDTTVHVSASGSFANSTAGDTVDIVLKGVSLADLGGGLGHTSDTQIIQNLLNHGKLITD